MDTTPDVPLSGYWSFGALRARTLVPAGLFSALMILIVASQLPVEGDDVVPFVILVVGTLPVLLLTIGFVWSGRVWVGPDGVRVTGPYGQGLRVIPWEQIAAAESTRIQLRNGYGNSMGSAAVLLLVRTDGRAQKQGSIGVSGKFTSRVDEVVACINANRAAVGPVVPTGAAARVTSTPPALLIGRPARWYWNAALALFGAACVTVLVGALPAQATVDDDSTPAILWVIVGLGIALWLASLVAYLAMRQVVRREREHGYATLRTYAEKNRALWLLDPGGLTDPKPPTFP